jgi:hypothetical protein
MRNNSYSHFFRRSYSTITIAGHRHSGIQNFILVPDKKMPDHVSLVQYRICSGIISFFHSCTGLTGCRTVWHSGFLSICTWKLTLTSSIDIDMQHGHGHGHAVWTSTCSMDMDTQHGFGHAAWICTVDLHGCWSADKKLSPASLVFC